MIATGILQASSAADRKLLFLPVKRIITRQRLQKASCKRLPA